MTGEGGSEIAVILLDENGTIVDAHASCVETFGWQRAELLGKDVRDLLQYGRDLLMSQLQTLEDESAANTSFSVRVLARRKDQRQFPARATVRRFQELECWTVAFYRAETELSEAQVIPSVSPEEIALAKRALEEASANPRPRKEKNEPQKGETMPVSRLWRNSRLLFSSRDEKTNSTPAPEPETQSEADTEIVSRAEAENVEQQIVAEGLALAAQCAPPASVQPEPPPEPFIPLFEPKPSIIPMPRPEPSHAAHDNLPQLARLRTELEKERGERARIEQRCASLSSQVQSLHLQLSENLDVERENASRIAQLETELRAAREQLAQAETDFESEKCERQAADEHLGITRELITRLEENLAQSDGRARTFEATQQELQNQLERSQSLLRDAESNLDKEREARQQSELMLEAALRDQRTFEQNTTAELCRLRTGLEAAEFEKNRNHEHVLRARAEAFESARRSRAIQNDLRKSFSEVLERINGTTSELLQSPLTEEQKCVIEALLQEILSLEACLTPEAAPEPADAVEA